MSLHAFDGTKEFEQTNSIIFYNSGFHFEYCFLPIHKAGNYLNQKIEKLIKYRQIRF